MRYIATIAAAAVIGLSALPASAADITLGFSDRIAKKLPALNRIEQQREENFRKTGNSNVGVDNRSAFRFNEARFHGTEWAGERLIPDVSDYTVENLIEAIAHYNAARLGDAGDDAHLRLTLTTLKVANAPLAALSGVHTYAKGLIERLDPVTGEVLESHKVTSNFVRKPTIDDSYTGPALAFLETDPNNRVGPILAQFVADAFEEVYPDVEFAEVRIIQLASANFEQIINVN